MNMSAYKCEKCGKLHHPHYKVCQNPKCGGREFTESELGGKCKLLTWTRAFNLPEGYMQAWLNFGIVEFENGLRAMGQIGFDDDIANGMALNADVEQISSPNRPLKYGFVFKKA